MNNTKAKFLRQKVKFIPNIYPWKEVMTARETIFAKQGLNQAEIDELYRGSLEPKLDCTVAA